MTQRHTFIASSRQQPCVLCQNTRFLKVSDHDRRGNPLVTVLCNDCGLISHEQIPEDMQLAEYYALEYRQDYHGEFTPSPYRVLREWRRGQELLSILADKLDPHSRVLEIGSGIGCTVKAFELAGYQSSGIEPGEGFCRYSREQLQAAVQQSSLEQLGPCQPQQLVLLVHVLEHFNDPARSLKTVHQLLDDHGLCYIEVPNFSAPHAAPGKQFHFAHIYNYTSSTLSLLAENNGLELLEQLSGPRDKNLKMLFRKAEPPALDFRLPSDGHSREESLQALTRYNSLTYHLRWDYLRDRISTIVSHRKDRWRAATRLKNLLQDFQPSQDQTHKKQQAAA